METGLLPRSIQFDLSFLPVQGLIRSWQHLVALSVWAPTMSVDMEGIAFHTHRGPGDMCFLSLGEMQDGIINLYFGNLLQHTFHFGGP